MVNQLNSYFVSLGDSFHISGSEDQKLDMHQNYLLKNNKDISSHINKITKKAENTIPKFYKYNKIATTTNPHHSMHHNMDGT